MNELCSCTPSKPSWKQLSVHNVDFAYPHIHSSGRTLVLQTPCKLCANNLTFVLPFSSTPSNSHYSNALEALKLFALQHQLPSLVITPLEHALTSIWVEELKKTLLPGNRFYLNGLPYQIIQVSNSIHAQSILTRSALTLSPTQCCQVRLENPDYYALTFSDGTQSHIQIYNSDHFDMSAITSCYVVQPRLDFSSFFTEDHHKNEECQYGLLKLQLNSCDFPSEFYLLVKSPAFSSPEFMFLQWWKQRFNRVHLNSERAMHFTSDDLTLDNWIYRPISHAEFTALSSFLTVTAL